MLTYTFTNYDTGEELLVDAESFEIACQNMFYTGDEHDLDPKDWELTEVEEVDD